MSDAMIFWFIWIVLGILDFIYACLWWPRPNNFYQMAKREHVPLFIPLAGGFFLIWCILTWPFQIMAAGWMRYKKLPQLTNP
jgi:hypothetical protein